MAYLMAATAAHVRLHGSVLASIEKRVLVRIAARLPRWITSDHLSALSLLSLLVAGASFAAYRVTPWAAFAVAASLMANWFGDSLDGTLARVRGCERPRYGFYVDHVIDIVGTTFLLAGLASSPLMTPVVAVSLLAAFLLVSAESYLAAHSVGVFRLSFLGVGPTELRIAIVLGAIAAARSPYVTVGRQEWRLFDVGGFAGIVGLAAALLVSVVRNTLALHAAEPIGAARADTGTLPSRLCNARAGAGETVRQPRIDASAL